MASKMIPSKSTLSGNDERVSEDSSNADAAVCDHEQAPSDEEKIEFERTKEALTFKWYEGPEDWDRLCPVDKLKKITTTKNNDRISSDQKKEIQEEARHVGLLLKE
jgi:hypothetical protein